VVGKNKKKMANLMVTYYCRIRKKNHPKKQTHKMIMAERANPVFSMGKINSSTW